MKDDIARLLEDQPDVQPMTGLHRVKDQLRRAEELENMTTHHGGNQKLRKAVLDHIKNDHKKSKKQPTYKRL